jgi:gliding motility-associated-like protein
MLNLTVYPDVRLISRLYDTICSGETFIYEPQANTDGVSFSWTRLAGLGIDFAAGTDAINNEDLINTLDIPLYVEYVYTLGAGFCTWITDTVTVTVLPKPEILSGYPRISDSIVTLGAHVKIITQISANTLVQYRYRYGLNGVYPLIYDYDDDGGEYEHPLYEFIEGKNTGEIEISIGECAITVPYTFNLSYNLPNVITPNEETNNVLLPPITDNGQDIKFDIQVFNRLGSELYKGSAGWDGKYKGTLVAAGTYFYVLRYTQPDGKVLVFKQSVFVKY